MQTEYVNNTNHFTQQLLQTPAKISRGENYLGLPYLVLDYPRNFAPNNIFAIRTFFWWGKLFSTTLHFSGEHLKYLSGIEKHYERLKEEGYFIGINPDQWVHHFEPSNYTSIDNLSKEEFITMMHSMTHIKIAAKQPLGNWHLAATNLFQNWKLLMTVSGLIT
jgi:hypothetical protein